MEGKKQTAVEWLEETIKNGYKASQGIILSDFFNAISQAKQMEREQIEAALITGLVHWQVDKPIEQYYNETYEK
jgi:hypothetical protein